MRMYRPPVCVALLTAVAARAAGPTTAPTTQEGPTVVRLTLHPIAISDPPLSWELLPPLSEQHVGNAAYEYEFASHTLQQYRRDAIDRIDALLDAPTEKFSQADATDLLNDVWAPYIDSAARCQGAHWAPEFRERGVDVVLPHLSHMRLMAKVMAVRTRLALARGDLLDAHIAMQTNFAMVRQLRDQPFLVSSLVAAGIARITLSHGVERWVSDPRSPNLYWALSAMPASFFDLYATAEVERASLRFTDPPWLALAMDGHLPSDQWPRVLNVLTRLRLRDVITTNDGLDVPDFDDVKKRELAELDPVARAQLRADGKPAAVVAAMSAEEAVARYLFWQYGSVYDQMWKAWPLPFAEALGPLRLADAGFRRFIPTNDQVMGRLHPVDARYTLARADEHLAALRVIEALRDYAARHGGTPPASLDLITDLPIPIDPVTGRPFAYRTDGNVATLDLPAPADVKPRLGTRYVLTFTAN